MEPTETGHTGVREMKMLSALLLRKSTENVAFALPLMFTIIVSQPVIGMASRAQACPGDCPCERVHAPEGQVVLKKRKRQREAYPNLPSPPITRGEK